MGMRRALVMAFRIPAVCLVFAVSFIVGGMLSGLSAVAQQGAPPPPAGESFLLSFLVFSISVGVAVSYLVLRSSWDGWRLVVTLCLSVYGVSTAATQIETAWFLSSSLPRGTMQALFLQGAITTALAIPLSVLLLGKWRSPSRISGRVEYERPRTCPGAWTILLLVVAFVFLYMLFGYYVAWQSPAVREFYGGRDYPGFIASLRANWTDRPGLFALQVFRALLYIACVYPLVRMLRASRWETALAIALFLSVWSTALLLPNPLMPSAVAHAHLRETLGFGVVFGALAGALLWRRR